MRKLSKRVLSCLLCLICVLALFPVRAFAAGAIDPNRDVTLTIEYKHNKVPVANVPFDLYYVASIDAYAEFTLAGDFQKYPVAVNGLTSGAWRTLAETLAAYVARDQLKPLDSGKTNTQGVLSFPNQQSSLKPGLYLVIGRKLIQDGYTYTTEPFLVSLPDLDQKSDVWTYDVVTAPKHTRTENPPTPSDETVERRVLKVWKEDDRRSRPGDVIIQLLKDGVVYDTVTLNAANNWRYTWEKLPKYNSDGSKIVWSVVEKELDNYTVSVTQEGITFVVTNTGDYPDIPDQPTPENPGPKLPQTGVLWWPVPVLAAVGLVFLVAGTLFLKKKEHE